MLRDRVFGRLGKTISCVLIITTQAMTAHIAYAQDRMANAIADANQLAKQLSNRSLPYINANGDVIVNGDVLSSSAQLTGQKSNDYIPAQTDTYGDDGKTILQGQQAQNKYEQKTLETAETSGEIAYHILKKSFSTQKPDLNNDPLWNNTDNVLDNLPDIAQGFANCEIDKELVSSGSSYHVPKYETCEKLPAIEESFTISHSYEIGIVKHHSGPYNFQECGDGCFKVWVGNTANDYWGGTCVIYEESVVLELINPNAITSVVFDYAQFDDYFQVYIDGTQIYNGPDEYFPPENPRILRDPLTGRWSRPNPTTGSWKYPCERSTSWKKSPKIDYTDIIKSKGAGDLVTIKNRTSVDSGGDSYGGEGYSKHNIYYDPKKKIFNDVWTTIEQIDKALQIKKQIDDGFCTGHITCTDMPAIDSNGCRTENGIKVCESDFQSNPIFGLGISPFCKRVDVVSDCGFNGGEICFTNMEGIETCFDNDTVDRNTCEQYEQDPECSYVKSECVGGAEGESGFCYVQEDTYDCGFTATTGQETEEEVLRCDGQIQCIGESCYSPVRDMPNEDFGEVNAYLEMLKYARSDMSCAGVPERPFDPESPPDRYYPVTGCPDGFAYDKNLDKCLSQTGCDYDDANFYAASHRNGIQVVKNNAVVVDNNSVTQCIPVQQDALAYTCGNAVQKQETDVFYEVCTNKLAATIPNSCPNESHELNSTTGYCEVPPHMECPDNYELIEGNDEFDPTDDTCLSKRLPVDKRCDSGFVYVSETDRCEKTDTTQIIPICEVGYTLTNGTCVATETIGATFYCTSGTLNGQICEDQYTECRYDASNQIYEPYNLCAVEEGYSGFVLWSGTRPSTLYKGRQMKLSYESCRIRDKTRNGWGFYYEVCADLTSSVDASASCPTDYVLNGGQCSRTVSSSVIRTCPDGYELHGDTCSKTEHTAYIPTCYSPWVLHPNKQECWMQPETMPAEASCPSQFPIWNDAEKRCQSDPYDVINTTSVEFKENNQANSEQPANVQLKQLMQTVLAPFAYLMDAAVPSVVANAELHDTEESQVTQESMNNYIAGKFGEIADTMENDLETYQMAQAQLGVRAMAASPQIQSYSAPQVQSFAAPQAASAGGDQNVTCELFKGEAMECKIAVGGMQNCCENPVAISLSDYISLTRNMISMDAMTGAVFNIEGYHGVWEMGKGYVAEGADAAWNFVSSPWASGADAATGVAEKAVGDVASEGMMHTFSQAVMTYTNEFLKSVFSDEVAKLFFKTTVDTATKETVIQASSQMAAVGQVLMYCYYAYLAYVVFNLLINIIFACEDAELDLAMKRDLLSTHYIGSYCKTEALFVCIEKRNVHCVFDSPLSRIMMEQIYKQPQMGLSWGSPESPNCRGIGIAELDKVDWDQVSLDEWIGILIQTDNYTDMVDIDLDSLTGSGSPLQTGEDRMDVLERNQERFKDVDIDGIRRDAYEEGWNRNQ
ncbi:conjugal transfer protein TraN [Vibrio mediterranei]|uniref:conjugal transfer protein TraN n=1 Tax=Vibrio mediterranei TaxID=689 RepID=UPI0040696356